MKYEKSAGAIIFRESGEGRQYLLLAYPGLEDRNKIYWGFPKGHVEAGESEAETARREIGEETGINDYTFVEGFKEKEKYMFKREGGFVNKTSVYFLAKTNQEGVVISPEHVGFEWLFMGRAVKRLSFKNARELLKKADVFLSTGSKIHQPLLSI
jgi:8-oxo-dGTP pyrophosphatase MutT (NUDIX family)